MGLQQQSFGALSPSADQMPGSAQVKEAASSGWLAAALFVSWLVCFWFELS